MSADDLPPRDARGRHPWQATAAPVRDFDALARRLGALAGPGLTCREVGQRSGHSLYRVDVTGTEPAPARVLVAAGTHGDEPAGTEAVLRLLEGDLSHLGGRADLVLLPCINPWGYVHDTRQNADGVDINRSFEDGGAPEAVFVKELLDGERFDLFVEFHEDWEFDGYYLFECPGPSEPVGPAIIDRVRRVGPIYDRPAVDEVPIVGGVVIATDDLLQRLGNRIGMKPLPLWLYGTGRARHTITSETPSAHWDLDRRVEAHLAAFEVALERLLR